MQLVVSVGLIVVGLVIALGADTAGEMRIFGWVLAGVGVLALVMRWVIARQGGGGNPPRRLR
jgi:hypothetical protein